MKVHNTTIFMGDATKQQRKNGLQQEDEQKRGSVFAGNLNKILTLLPGKSRMPRSRP